MNTTIFNFIKKKNNPDRIAFIFIKELLKIIVLDEQINADANRNKFFYFNIPSELKKNLDHYNLEFRFYDKISNCDMVITIPKNFSNNKNYKCIHNIIRKNDYLDYTTDELIYIRYDSVNRQFENIFINDQ